MRRTPIVIALMLLACGENDSGSALAGEDSAAAAEPTTEILHATIEDNDIELSLDSIPAGEASILIANRSANRHSLRIQSVDDYWSVANLMSGEDATLRVDLSPGVYELYCPDVDADGPHASQGVYARLVVTDNED